MEPLSVRLYEFIRSNPGLDGTHIISSVLDFRTEKVSDAERILQVLNNTGKVYACEIFDPEVQRFVSFYYPMDAIPSYAGIPGRKEACRCPGYLRSRVERTGIDCRRIMPYQRNC